MNRRQSTRATEPAATPARRPAPPATREGGVHDRPPADETQASVMRQTRLSHSSETAEDYVKAIARLTESVGEARAVDLARHLGVSHVTVVRTVARLQRDGFVSTRPYRAVFLTDRGARLAKTARDRYRLVVDFLQSLGIPEAAARADAEGIEHHVSADTLAAFRRHLASRSRR
jgi:DtxR family manganese transport transcriptional regulator